jgi:hypothetical protein
MYGTFIPSIDQIDEGTAGSLFKRRRFLGFPPSLFVSVQLF